MAMATKLAVVKPLMNFISAVVFVLSLVVSFLPSRTVDSSQPYITYEAFFTMSWSQFFIALNAQRLVIVDLFLHAK